MHELNNPESKWSTYLRLFPDYAQFDLPMFWDKYSFIKREIQGNIDFKSITIDLFQGQILNSCWS